MHVSTLLVPQVTNCDNDQSSECKKELVNKVLPIYHISSLTRNQVRRVEKIIILSFEML